MFVPPLPALQLDDKPFSAMPMARLSACALALVCARGLAAPNDIYQVLTNMNQPQGSVLERDQALIAPMRQDMEAAAAQREARDETAARQQVIEDMTPAAAVNGLSLYAYRGPQMPKEVPAPQEAAAPPQKPNYGSWSAIEQSAQVNGKSGIFQDTNLEDMAEAVRGLRTDVRAAMIDRANHESEGPEPKVFQAEAVPAQKVDMAAMHRHLRAALAAPES